MFGVGVATTAAPGGGVLSRGGGKVNVVALSDCRCGAPHVHRLCNAVLINAHIGSIGRICA